MVDRLVSGGVVLLVLGLIAFSCGGAVLLAYRGVFEIVCRHWSLGALKIAAAIPLAIAAWMLIRNKEDLLI